ncbi:MAG: polyphosphate kinase 1 [Bacteroidales bacterium]|jgi:polyphosphate kinase|nr:polyphosphate kinase 1 [Bacteroidales bacterium]
MPTNTGNLTKVKEKLPILNRDLNWLYFNGRVLQEAADERNPLLERLRFLGIFSNNRDEFFRVRVATLNRMLKVERMPYDTPINPKKALKEIGELVQIQEHEFMQVYGNIVHQLGNHNIFIVNENQLTEEQGQSVLKYFHEQVRAYLFPIMISSLKDISSLRDKSIYLAVKLGRNDKALKEDYALIEVPTSTLSRFFILPSNGDKRYIMLLDDVIRYCLSEIFSIFGYNSFSAYTVKLTRDAEIDIDTDVSKSFLEVMKESLKQRKRGIPVRFVYDKSIPDDLLKIITKRLDITKDDPIRGGGRYHNFKDFMGFPNLGHRELENGTFVPLKHKDLPTNRSILSSIRQKDIMLHYPYQSFQYIIDLLREVSIDPKVRSIKMTIYRAAKNSNVINALINAARNGKFVTVFMELQARFDEEANIYWTGRLREEGIKVIHSIPGFKVHCKLMLIRRKENNTNFYYAFLGTGNFNEDTAKVYSDMSLLTCNQKICADVDNAFHLMEENYRPYKFKTLIVAPFSMRNFFIKMLSNEIQNAKKGKEAWAIIKLNSIVDEVMVRKLYKASQAGVKIKLIIRGICTLVPGIPGISDNIEAISIVDRFLEHTRVIVFANGGDNQYFITSADWMIRNFDNRIEVATPIFDPVIKEQLKSFLEIQLADNVKARIIGPGKANQYKHSDGPAIRSQVEVYKYLEGQMTKDEGRGTRDE